jgi:hypothetical protein
VEALEMEMSMKYQKLMVVVQEYKAAIIIQI